MINVAFVHHALHSGGGSERVIFDVMRGLDRTRFRPVLVCMYELGEWGERLRAMGCATFSDLMKGPYDLRGLWRIAQVLKRETIDILYVSDGRMNMVYGRAASAIANTPVTALAFHSYDTVIRRRASRFKRLMMTSVDSVYHPRFSYFISLAESHKKYLVECKGLPAAKIVIINNGVHISEYEAEVNVAEKRTAWGIPIDARVAVMVAGLRRWKSHDVLLLAAARLLKEMPDVHFLLAGEGNQRLSIEQMAEDLGIAQHVHLLGHVSDIAGLLRASDVAVLSSEHEAFPLSLLEAMAAARPVVATNTGSVAEMVIDGVNGHLVQVGAPSELADSLARILRDSQLAKAMGEAGRQLVCERFAIEHTVDAYEQLFEAWATSSTSR